MVVTSCLVVTSDMLDSGCLDYSICLPASARCLLTQAFAVNGQAQSSIALVSKARSYLRHASVPLPERLDAYNYLNRLGAETLLHPEFHAQINEQATVSGKRDWFHAARANDDLNRMLALGLQSDIGRQ